PIFVVKEIEIPLLDIFMFEAVIPPFKPKEVVCACVVAAAKVIAAIANRNFLIVGVLFCLKKLRCKYHKFLKQIQYYDSFFSEFCSEIAIFRFSIISIVIVARSYFGFQPQSFLATESSILRGQLSAICCRKSGSYIMLKPGICFLISAAISFGEKLIP